MVKKLTVDSSVFISSLQINDRFHESSKNFFRQIEPTRAILIIPSIVVAEVLHILTHQATPPTEETGPLHDSFYESERFQVISLDRTFTARFVQVSARLEMKTSDALIAATALFYQTTVVSWDKKLIARASPFLKALTPDQFLKQPP